LLLSACGPVHLFEKRWMMPRHKIWVMLCTLWACINKTQDLCTSSINMCLDIIGRSSSQGKKKQTKQNICIFCNKDPLLVAHRLILCLLL
jgi:hypothetical protein